MRLSIISPVYRAEAIVSQLVARLVDSLDNIGEAYEIILVEDGSPDNSWAAIARECERDQRIRGIRLSRNFGQHNAIYAGLQASSGEWVVVMDCDLQDRPEEIVRLYQKALEGYDIVLARRAVRQDHLLKRWGSKLFYKLFGYLTDTRQDPAVSNFGVYHRSVIEAILSMGDYVRVFPVMVQWVGFQRTAIDVGHAAREAGKSSYTLGKLFRLAFGMMLSFSEKPLRLGLRAGLFISFFAFCIGVFNFIKYLKGEILVAGYTSLILSLWFLSGIIIAFIGLTGLYIGKIFEKVKGRPNYIVQSRKNFGE